MPSLFSTFVKGPDLLRPIVGLYADVNPDCDCPRTTGGSTLPFMDKPIDMDTNFCKETPHCGLGSLLESTSQAPLLSGQPSLGSTSQAPLLGGQNLGPSAGSNSAAPLVSGQQSSHLQISTLDAPLTVKESSVSCQNQPVLDHATLTDIPSIECPVIQADTTYDLSIDIATPSSLPNGVTMLSTHCLDKYLVTDEHNQGFSINNLSANIQCMWPSLTDKAKQEAPKFAELYHQIKARNLPNFLGAHVTLDSGLNLDAWDHALQHYHDQDLLLFLRYGWPVGYNANTPPAQTVGNHQSGRQYIQHVRDFIATELRYDALVGPFTALPFYPWSKSSPIITRPKKNSLLRRVIVDLSFPRGQAVNDGIDTSSYLGTDISYTLPAIQDLIARVEVTGAGAYIWKADLERAYRQLRVDPLDTPLLGIEVDGLYYLDLCPSFGCRSSSSACQRTSSALSYLMAKRGFHTLAYLDDFAGCEQTLQQAQQAYDCFHDLCNSLGLALAAKKCQPPATEQEWLGFVVNTEEMVVTIPLDKLQEVIYECRRWTKLKYAKKQMIQSLVGRLMHIAKCIPAGRKFITRILTTLRKAPDVGWVHLDEDFKADVAWFAAYAAQGNGVTLIAPVRHEFHIDCDSSLDGGGGHSEHEYYIWSYTDEHKLRFPLIIHREAINLLVAYRTLRPQHASGITIVLNTDNMASSYALATGRTKDKTLAAAARELWLEAAKADSHIDIRHKYGRDMPLADALSRVTLSVGKRSLAQHYIAQSHLGEVSPNLSGHLFTPSL